MIWLASFRARGSDGSTCKVCGFERLAKDESLVDVLEDWEPTGALVYRLADGESVDVRRDGSMRVAKSGIELSIRKRAPAGSAAA